MALAQQLARAGRYEQAQPVFTRVLELEPGQPEAALGLADTLQRGGDHAAAVEAYRPALQYRSTTLAARLGSARSLVALRRLDDARKMLEEGLPDHAAASALRLELSRVYARLGLTEMAEREAQAVQQLRERGDRP
jgi:tetratricopeptide (TPR) repeat protein